MEKLLDDLPARNSHRLATSRIQDVLAMDFFVVPTATFRLLYVLVVMNHERRKIVHFNLTNSPTAAWTAQQIVNAFPYDTAPKYLLRDRDSIYGSASALLRRRRGQDRRTGTRSSVDVELESTVRSDGRPPLQPNAQATPRGYVSKGLQSSTSFVPPLGSDKSKVLTLNLRNRSDPMRRRFSTRLQARSISGDPQFSIPGSRKIENLRFAATPGRIPDRLPDQEMPPGAALPGAKIADPPSGRGAARPWTGLTLAWRNRQHRTGAGPVAMQERSAERCACRARRRRRPFFNRQEPGGGHGASRLSFGNGILHSQITAQFITILKWPRLVLKVFLGVPMIF